MKNTMTPDESYAALSVTALIVVITQKQFSRFLMELLLKLTRPGATVLLLGLLVFLWVKGLHYTFLALAILVVFLLQDMWTHWVRSDSRRLYLEMGIDNDRFDPKSSIDIQMADKTVVHGPPKIYNKHTTRTLLVFPPSAETLEQLSG
jgi:hypothetical protein